MRFGLCLIVAFLAGDAVGMEEHGAITLESVQNAASAVVPADPANEEVSFDLERVWDGSLCKTRLVNTDAKPLRAKEAVLFHIPITLPGDTAFYGEGFTMLSQTGGTLDRSVALGGYTDKDHYKIPQPADATVAYGMLTLTPPGGDTVLMAFTSCKRFVGKFYVRRESIDVVVDTEGLALAPGDAWDLEEFLFCTGKDRSVLLASLAERIETHHPRLEFAPVPTGWCSWYCFGPMVTAKQVDATMQWMGANMPSLKYIQIDDGYQAAMGDWLATGKAFHGGIRDVLAQIKQSGFEPAIWVAPFVAEEKSQVFQEHPEWFIQDAEGKPLRSDRVTFGGWRCGPWYALDGTHPGAQQHLEEVFRTMRDDWGCTYFKLDANFWGAMHGGCFHDPKATRVEAYRRGMEAIRRGARDAFILGCNHPIWPSLGLIHGSRSSNDVGRSWDSFSHVARETFFRNWQNGRLWWNDPDCVLLTGKLPEDEFRFHATAIYASGGMLLSGDDLTRISPERLAMLRVLDPPTGVAARFEDDTFRVGIVDLKDKRLVCLFNWNDAPQTIAFPLEVRSRVTDCWSHADLGVHEGRMEMKDLPPHSATLLACVPEGR